MSREQRMWSLGIAGLGGFVALMILVGTVGTARPDVDPLTVTEILSGGDPAARFGDEELHVVGWYAELDADCEGDDGGVDADVAWLQADCPLRVLLPEQPAADVTQEELLSRGLRLAAPLGKAFPSRAEPGGPNLRGQQLVFVGHFADPAAASCVPDRAERCRGTFVATDYDEQVR